MILQILLDYTNWLCCVLRPKWHSSLCCRSNVLHNNLSFWTLLSAGGFTGYLVKESEQHVEMWSVLSLQCREAHEVCCFFSSEQFRVQQVWREYRHVPDHWVPRNFAEVIALEFSCYCFHHQAWMHSAKTSESLVTSCSSGLVSRV